MNGSDFGSGLARVFIFYAVLILITGIILGILFLKGCQKIKEYKIKIEKVEQK